MTPAVAVYCDFDGTVTEDVVDVLLTELADPRWREVEAEWVAGRIGSRECLARQIPLIRGGWAAVVRRLRQVKIELSFRPFVSWCRSRGIPVWIVSDGPDRVIHTLLNRDGIAVDGVLANHLEESPTGQFSLMFPYPSIYPQCRAGLCKCQFVERKTTRTLHVIIGDGQSDYCWAEQADWLFAKDALLTHCRSRGIPCTAFEDFDTIRLAIEGFLGSGENPKGGGVQRQPQAAVHG